jgi:hypothetical protein
VSILRGALLGKADLWSNALFLKGNEPPLPCVGIPFLGAPSRTRCGGQDCRRRGTWSRARPPCTAFTGPVKRKVRFLFTGYGTFVNNWRLTFRIDKAGIEIMIRRCELPRWRVTPLASARPTCYADIAKCLARRWRGDAEFTNVSGDLADAHDRRQSIHDRLVRPPLIFLARCWIKRKRQSTSGAARGEDVSLTP